MGDGMMDKIEEVKKLHDRTFGEGIACQYDYSLRGLSLGGIEEQKQKSWEQFKNEICQLFPKPKVKLPENPYSVLQGWFDKEEYNKGVAFNEALQQAKEVLKEQGIKVEE